jgi:putative two-component system response regulator
VEPIRLQLMDIDRGELWVLVVEHEAAVQQMVAEMLRAEGFTNVRCVGDGRSAVEAAKAIRPDIALLDLHMPGMPGERVLEQLIGLYRDEITVIVMTGYASVEQAVDLMRRGAFDYVVKPFRLKALLASLERAAERCKQVWALAGAMDLMVSLVRLMESKDRYLRDHSARVRDYAVAIARTMHLDSRATRLVAYAALLHDLGKSMIDSGVLNKVDPLTPDEVRQIQRHPVVSRDIIVSNRYLSRIVPHVYLHHERYNGTGYPEGLWGDQIPLPARIIAVADAYDAMTSERAYRPALGPRQALNVLRSERGALWDPDAVDALLSIAPPEAAMGNDVPLQPIRPPLPALAPA